MLKLTIRNRIHAHAAFASVFSAYVLIGIIWLPLLYLFFAIMHFRLGHLLPHATLVNDPPCAVPECDFSVFWSVGKLARRGDFTGLYTPAQLLLWGREVLLPSIRQLDWFYPPPSLLPVAAISFFPFNIAYFVWTIGFAAVGTLLLRWAGLAWSVIIVSLLSPAALWTMEMGQFEILTNALLVAGLLTMRRRSAAAGAWLGLLVLKPQTGLLGPVAVLARRDFKALIVFIGIVAAIVAFTTALFGMVAWRAYLVHGLATSRMLLTQPHPPGVERGVSIFWMLRSLGAGLPASYAVQGLSTLASVGLTWLVWRRPHICSLDRMALTVFLTLLATPYGYVDDMVAYSVALAALAQARGWRIGLLDALFWLWPALCPFVFAATGMVCTPLIVALALARTWRDAGIGLPWRALMQPVPLHISAPNQQSGD